jgi:hypothetical protein
MRRLAIAAGIAAWVLGLPAVAQTWGQPVYRAPTVTWGQPHAGWGGGVSEWDGRAYAVTGRAATGYVNGSAPAYGAGYGDPRAYRPPNRPLYGGGHGRDHDPSYRGHDRGGRYGYSPANRWTRWSSPPGRGYHDAYGYNDDRPPRGFDQRRDRRDPCECGIGAYLYDR